MLSRVISSHVSILMKFSNFTGFKTKIKPESQGGNEALRVLGSTKGQKSDVKASDESNTSNESEAIEEPRRI